AAAVHVALHVRVGEAAVAALDGDVRTAAEHHVAIDEIGRDVERLGHAEPLRRDRRLHEACACASRATISAGNGCGTKVVASTHATRYDASQISRSVARSRTSNRNPMRRSVIASTPTPIASSSPSFAGERNPDCSDVRGMNTLSDFSSAVRSLPSRRYRSSSAFSKYRKKTPNQTIPAGSVSAHMTRWLP